MDRRNFLKLSGLAAAALLFQVNPLGKIAFQSQLVELQGRFYRGTHDGKILMSDNAGRTWQLHTNFGRGLSITGLFTNFSGQLLAQLEYAGHPFEVALVQNSRTWRTM